MRLTTKILAVHLALVSLLAIVAGWISVRAAHEEFEADQRDFARRLAVSIDKQLLLAWRQSGPTGVARFLSEASAANQGLLEVRWVWLDSSELPTDRPWMSLVDWAVVPFGEAISMPGYDEAGRQRLFTYVPVQLTPDRRGALEFSSSLDALRRKMWRSVWWTLSGIGMVVVLSAATAYFSGLRWVARPLEQLVDKTERIGRGDFGSPLEVRGGDELSDLAAALNAMSERLIRQREELASEGARRLAVLEQLRHADRLKTVGRLAAGLGHELGTPLNVISGRAALILSGRLSASEVSDSARSIKSESDRIIGLVRQLLDFARPRQPQRQSIDLRETLKATVELIQPLADRQGVELAWEEGFETSPPATLSADGGQLLQVFTNMVVNAIQAMPGGGRVEVGVRRERLRPPREGGGGGEGGRVDCWVATISDNGPGISAEHLPLVFEPFFTTKDVGEGSGLGLSVSHGIVEEHGGWIAVDSAAGAGARFQVVLPVSAEGAPGSAADSEASAEGAPGRAADSEA